MGWGILLLNPPIRSCLPVESEIYTGCKEENQDKYSPAGILPSKTLGKVIQDWYFCKRLNPQRMKRGQLELYCDHTSVSRDQSKTDLIQLVRWLFILCSNWKLVCKMIVSFYAAIAAMQQDQVQTNFQWHIQLFLQQPTLKEKKFNLVQKFRS